MASPSPLDRCWAVKDASQYGSLLTAIHAAIENQWPHTKRAASTILGDEALAGEIMECAIRRTVDYLAEHPEKQNGDARAVLSRFCRLEIRRRRIKRRRSVQIDDATASEAAAPAAPFAAVEAALDIEKMLADAPPKVRAALMMRYGGAETWSEVAQKTATSPEAIRKSCQRYLDRLRRRLGIFGGST